MNDSRLEELKTEELKELPLITCLNCSLYEDIQNFKINIMERSIHTITQSEMFDWKYELIDKIPVPLPKYDMKLITMRNMMSLVMKMKMTKLLMRWEETIFVEYLEHLYT